MATTENDRTKHKFSVTAYNTYGYGTSNRVVARFDLEAESLQKALDSAAATCRAWNLSETRTNMTVCCVEAWGTVRAVRAQGALPEQDECRATKS